MNTTDIQTTITTTSKNPIAQVAAQWLTEQMGRGVAAVESGQATAEEVAHVGKRVQEIMDSKTEAFWKREERDWRGMAIDGGLRDRGVGVGGEIAGTNIFKEAIKK